MQMMTPRIGDLSMDGPNTLLVSCTLSLGEGLFILSIVPQMRYLRSIRTCGQCFEAKIKRDLTLACTLFCINFYVKVKIPTPSCIFTEVTALNFPFDIPAEPKAITPFQVNNSFIAKFDRTSSSEWYPSQRSLTTPAWTTTMRVTTTYKLLANCLNSITVQAEQEAAACSQSNQIIRTWPRFIVASRSVLNVSTVVPDQIDCLCKHIEMFPARCVLNPVAIGQYHSDNLTNMLAGLQTKNGGIYELSVGRWI